MIEFFTQNLTVTLPLWAWLCAMPALLLVAGIGFVCGMWLIYSAITNSLGRALGW